MYNEIEKEIGIEISKQDIATKKELPGASLTLVGANNTIIDTLGISRYLDSHLKRHNLATLVIRYNIEWDEDKHHRASYDALGTAIIFFKMLERLALNNIDSLTDLKRYRTIVLR